MSAPTGIEVSRELSSTFADAVASQNVRFLKITISNESLVPDLSIPPSGSLQQDLAQLDHILQDAEPAYVLVRLDEPPSEWLAIYYVPENAKIRDKMLYAATRNTLVKSLGATHFTDSIFATTKADLMPDAYVKHRKHVLAPKPMNEREKEIAEVNAAERAAGRGTQARQGIIEQGIGFKWTAELEDAIKELGAGNDSELLIMSLDVPTETLGLASSSAYDANSVGAALPASDPVYALFAWSQSITSPPRREIVFIYSCPSSSPVKHRMLYSSGSVSVLRGVRDVITASGSTSVVASRRVETSAPSEIDEAFLVTELGLESSASSSGARAPPGDPDKKPFAKPRGPARKR